MAHAPHLKPHEVRQIESFCDPKKGSDLFAPTPAERAAIERYERCRAGGGGPAHNALALLLDRRGRRGLPRVIQHEGLVYAGDERGESFTRSKAHGVPYRR